MITIYPDPSNPDEIGRIARLLLDAADNPAYVRLETFGSGPYFVVPDEVALKAQLTDPPEEETKEPVKRGRKRKEPDNG